MQKFKGHLGASDGIDSAIGIEATLKFISGEGYNPYFQG